MNIQQLFDALVAEVPEVRALVDEHLADHDGEWLGHLLLADLDRYVSSHFTGVRLPPTRRPPTQAEVRRLLATLDAQHAELDAYTQNAVAVSFVEHVRLGDHCGDIERWLGPALQAEIARQRAAGAAAPAPRHELVRSMDEMLELLADPGAQRDYERDVPIADVPAELVCMWEDLYHPDSRQFAEAFSAEQLAALADFDEVFERHVDALPLDDGVVRLQADPRWSEIVAAAAAARAKLNHAP